MGGVHRVAEESPSRALQAVKERLARHRGGGGAGDGRGNEEGPIGEAWEGGGGDDAAARVEVRAGGSESGMWREKGPVLSENGRGGLRFSGRSNHYRLERPWLWKR